MLTSPIASIAPSDGAEPAAISPAMQRVLNLLIQADPSAGFGPRDAELVVEYFRRLRDQRHRLSQGARQGVSNPKSLADSREER